MSPQTHACHQLADPSTLKRPQTRLFSSIHFFYIRLRQGTAIGCLAYWWLGATDYRPSAHQAVSRLWPSTSHSTTLQEVLDGQNRWLHDAQSFMLLVASCLPLIFWITAPTAPLLRSPLLLLTHEGWRSHSWNCPLLMHIRHAT
jgi:hypothetical protein